MIHSLQSLGIYHANDDNLTETLQPPLLTEVWEHTLASYGQLRWIGGQISTSN